jgi:hypothetical protein
MIVLSEGHRCKKLPKIGLFQLDRKLTQQNSISKQNETQTLAYYPIIETSLQKTQNLLPYLRQSKLWFQNSCTRKGVFGDWNDLNFDDFCIP